MRGFRYEKKEMKGKKEKRGGEGKRKELGLIKGRNNKASWKWYFYLGRKG
jgi:hypothetical protein